MWSEAGVAGQQSDPGMPEREKVPGRHSGGLLVVGADAACNRDRRQTVDEDDGHTPTLQRCGGRGIGAAAEQDAVDALREQGLQMLLLSEGILVGVAEQHAIAEPLCRVFDAAHDLGIEGVGDVGNDDADDAGAAGLEAARDGVRMVVECLHRGVHFLAPRLAHR